MTAGEFTEFVTQLRSSHASLLLGVTDLSEVHLQDSLNLKALVPNHSLLHPVENSVCISTDQFIVLNQEQVAA